MRKKKKKMKTKNKGRFGIKKIIIFLSRKRWKQKKISLSKTK
jgi:hypothetical protein